MRMANVFFRSSSPLSHTGFGGLATGDSKNQPTPVVVPALGEFDVATVSLGIWHTAIVTVSGELYTCGYGRYGALGLGHSTDNRLNLTRVHINDEGGASKRIVDAACGQYHTLVVTSDGELWSFGFGLGRGLGNNELDGFPRRVPDLNSVVQVSAGTYHSACVLRSGAALAWGIRSRKPVLLELPSEEHAVSVSCGSRHTAVLTQSGSIFSFFLQMSSHGYSSPSTAAAFYLGSSNYKLTAPHSQYWTKMNAGHGFTVAVTNQNEIFTFGSFPPSGTITDSANEYDDLENDSNETQTQS